MTTLPARSRDSVDLRARFGDRYRIGWEADGATKSRWPKDERAWLLEIRCRYGVVYPYGGEILAAWTDRPRIGARLRRLPCVRVARGDVEVVITFHVDDADQVFAVLRPYLRRRLSEAQRARNAATLAQTRGQRRESVTQSELAGPGSTRGIGRCPGSSLRHREPRRALK